MPATRRSLSRPLSTIAIDIAESWPRCMRMGPNGPYGPSQHPARPYVLAMALLPTQNLSSSYGLQHAANVVRYFLVNAADWNGQQARAIKAELESALADYDARMAA